VPNGIGRWASGSGSSGRPVVGVGTTDALPLRDHDCWIDTAPPIASRSALPEVVTRPLNAIPVFVVVIDPLPENWWVPVPSTQSPHGGAASTAPPLASAVAEMSISSTPTTPASDAGSSCTGRRTRRRDASGLTLMHGVPPTTTYAAGRPGS